MGQLYEYNRRAKREKARGSEKPESNSVETQGCGRKEKGVGIPQEVEQIIVSHRKENPDHGFKRIQDELKSRYLVVVSRKKIREVLKGHGLLESLDSSFDREKEAPKGTRRFEAQYPRELYQMDVTYVYITGIPVLYLIDIIDDYSRYCVGGQLRHDQQANALIEVLHSSCERHGKPKKLLTDQGSGFYSWSMQRTLLQEYLDDMRIEHIVADPHSPQTLGKAEKFHQSIKNELIRKVRFKSLEDAQRRIEEYIVGYNYERPHQGIGGARPADRFHGVIAETSRLEAELTGKKIDLQKGYLVWKVQGHTLSVVSTAEGLGVYLDGKLLRTQEGSL